MARITSLIVFALLVPVAKADLPPGALARLGDDRYRAGGSVEWLALSPDGKRYATVHAAGDRVLALTMWDAATGRRLHEQRVNRELFGGLVWGPGGAFAIAARTEQVPKGQRGKVIPDDFFVWDFTKPDTAPPLLPPEPVERLGGSVTDGSPKRDGKYTGFLFSADGKRVAAWWESAEGTIAVRVFELKPAASAAKLVRVGTLDFGADSPGAARFSADGKALVTFRVLANSDAMAATVWDVASGKPQPSLLVSSAAAGVPPLVLDTADHKRITHRLMLTPDGRSLVLHAAEEKEWGFDVVPLFLPYKSAPQKPVRVRFPYGPADRTLHRVGERDSGAYEFFPSGEVLVVSTHNDKTRVIDVTTGKELGRLEGHAYTPYAIAVSANSDTIATADLYGLVRLWDAKTLRPLSAASGHRAPVEHAELSPDGKRLLTWAPDETVRLWDVATGAELRAFTSAPEFRKIASWWSNRPTFTPDGTAILFSTKDRLTARDLITGLEVPLPGDLANSKPRHAVFAPDGKAVLTWADAEPPITVHDWPSGKKRFELAPDGPVRPARFSSNGTVVLADVCDGKRWDARTGKELPQTWEPHVADDVEPLLALRPNPALLLYRSHDNDAWFVREAGTGAPVSRFRLKHWPKYEEPFIPSTMALSPTGGQFVAKLRSSLGVALCEAATGQVRRMLDGHRGEVRVLGFTPDGTKLFTAGGDHTVLVWDMRLRSVPLPESLKNETSAAKLWESLATGSASDAYLAMARLAHEPDAAVKLVRMKLKPAAKGGDETEPAKLTDARAIELIEALDTHDSRKLLKELAAGGAEAFRTQEAKRALERNTR